MTNDERWIILLKKLVWILKTFANSQDDKQVAKDGKVFVICANWKLKIHLLSHRK